MGSDHMIAATKLKHPRAAALNVARELVKALRPVSSPDRLIVAGSLRRRKAEVGDVEIVYLSLLGTEPDGLFDFKTINLVDAVLDRLLASGVLAKRPNTLGSDIWGPKNKLALHCATGIPVDLFQATEANWFNYLVCRTGSAETNTRIAAAAQAKGWKWHPYDPGFTDEEGNWRLVRSEAEVFALAGLPYLDPWQR